MTALDAITLPEQVGQAASLLGLLLALVTLFTSEQAKRIDEEHKRQGGARSAVLGSVRWTCIGLAAVTAASIVALAPLIIDVISTIGGDRWEPVLGVFALTYALLGALLTWQIALAKKSA